MAYSIYYCGSCDDCKGRDKNKQTYNQNKELCEPNNIICQTIRDNDNNLVNDMNQQNKSNVCVNQPNTSVQSNTCVNLTSAQNKSNACVNQMSVQNNSCVNQLFAKN